MTRHGSDLISVCQHCDDTTNRQQEVPAILIFNRSRFAQHEEGFVEQQAEERNQNVHIKSHAIETRCLRAVVIQHMGVCLDHTVSSGSHSRSSHANGLQHVVCHCPIISMPLICHCGLRNKAKDMKLFRNRMRHMRTSLCTAKRKASCCLI